MTSAIEEVTKKRETFTLKRVQNEIGNIQVRIILMKEIFNDRKKEDCQLQASEIIDVSEKVVQKCVKTSFYMVRLKKKTKAIFKTQLNKK